MKVKEIAIFASLFQFLEKEMLLGKYNIYEAKKMARYLTKVFMLYYTNLRMYDLSVYKSPVF
jgi:hypothetical protein